TLVNHWLESMEQDHYRGARRVYGWSFFSQGTGERVVSSDEFLYHALAWFGDQNPEDGSAWDKAERLAGLVRSQRTLLILDGIEPLQSEQAAQQGAIKDAGLAALMTELARDNDGLCVLTTRLPLPELAAFPEMAIECSLDQMSVRAGQALLRVMGV